MSNLINLTNNISVNSTEKIAGVVEDFAAKLQAAKDSVPDANSLLHYNVLERGRDRVVDAAKDLLHGNVPRYSLYDQAKDLASQAGDRGGEITGGIKDKVEGFIAGLKAKGHDAAEGVRGAGYRLGVTDEGLGHWAGEHKGLAAGIGAGTLGAGGLAAYLATRDKKDRD